MTDIFDLTKKVLSKLNTFTVIFDHESTLVIVFFPKIKYLIHVYLPYFYF